MVSDTSLGELGAASIAIKTDLASFMSSVKLAKAELEKLELAGKPVQSGLTAAFNSAEKSVTSFVGGVKSAYVAIGGLLAALAVERVAGAVKSTLEWAQALKDLSVETGLSTEKIQQLQYRALQFGISTDTMTTGLLFFSKALGAFENDQSGPGAKAFEALGVKAGILNGTIRDSGQAFDVFEKNLRGVKNVNEAAAFSAEVFGRQLGPRLAAMLRESADETARFNAEAKSLGFIVGDNVVNAAAEANVKLNVLWETTKRDFVTQIGNLAPTIASLAQQLTADMPGILNWFEQLLFDLGAIDSHSLAGIDAQIGETKDEIASLQDRIAHPLGSKGAGWKAWLEGVFGQGNLDDKRYLAQAQSQLDALVKERDAFVKAHPPPKTPDTKEPPIILGASKAEIDAAKKLAAERLALLEKITAYDAAMSTADQKASKEMTAALDEDAIKTAEIAGDKKAMFAAQIKAAQDAAEAEAAVIVAESDQQIEALHKLNAEYKKLFGTDLPDYQTQLAAIVDETSNRMVASYQKSQTEIKGFVQNRLLFESDAAIQMRDAYMSAIDQSFSAFENFVQNGGNILQTLSGLAKQVASDISNTFIKLSIENPLLNALFAGQPGFTKLPTMGGLGSVFGSGGSDVSKPTGNAGDPVHVYDDSTALGGLSGGPAGGGGLPGSGLPGGSSVLNDLSDLMAGNASGQSIWSQLFGSSLLSTTEQLGEAGSGLTDIASAGMSSSGILSFLTDALAFIGLADGGPFSAGGL